jgi:regulator of sirC expression with transglutaminase-like and TPR domain
MLVNRLRDVSDGFVPTLAAEFRRLGAPAEQALRLALQAGIRGSAARRARQVLARLAADGPPVEYLAELAHDPYALEVGTAAIFLSIYDDPENADAQHLRRQLDRFSRVLRLRLKKHGAETPMQILDTSAAFFYGECDFQLNPRGPQDAANSHLHAILRTRYGRRESLGAAIIAITSWAEVPFGGLSLPGRFLLAYGAPAERVFMDPADGQRVPTDEVRELAELAELPCDPRSLRPASPRDIIQRLLQGLIGIYETKEDDEGAWRCRHLLRVVNGEQSARD